jgi:hypothetical protein
MLLGRVACLDEAREDFRIRFVVIDIDVEALHQVREVVAVLTRTR